ncbi:glutamyl-tRNA reductase [Tunturiibacter gelidoferens]|uniref:Glutamyl-tRNA reductase n=2 Tax=Tunturiibacter TaxID=3154218 RepID=A0A7Y9NNB9_9BACT|nr:glutamyl-tRNA reductase [Edaphobacter lichenicola]MBB5338414.1 glutamyl-tRNA reductase [Edaphobacter lichenicola]NYF52337.1 glutamyl-tRNA reductase [Edaphobacter lichenicola]
MNQSKPTSTQGRLILLGINHNTAPIEVRERLAIPAERLADATRTLLHQPGVREGLILSTCNRVELLTLQDDAESSPPQAKTDLLRFLHEYFAVPPHDIQPHLYEFREREAVRHLFRVASSLDSMVVGEPQILGQVKEAYTVARDAGAVSTHLEALMQRTFTVAKKIRTETQIGSSSVSIASVAVDLARKIFGSLYGKTVLLVGAGKMSELAARHLIQQGASSILVTNRTQSRAEKIASDFSSLTVHTEAIPFESLYEQADRADIVITSTGAPQKIFGRSHGQHFLHRRRNRPMFFIDIAVPRDVDPRMNEVEGCFVYDIDDLQQVAAANLADRSREAAAAENIVSREVDKYQERLQSRDAVPAIKALQQQAEHLRQAELARSQSKLADLTAQQRDAVEALTRSLTAKLLHPQLTALRESTRKKDSE